MNNLTSIDRALCLPAPDIAALLEGQNIIAIPRVSVQQGWSFALCPCDLLINSLSVQEQYHSYVHKSAQVALAALKTSPIKIEAWAKCVLSTIVHDTEQLEVLSCSSVWTKAALHKALEERQYLFLAYLQVYKLAEPVLVSASSVTPDKYGKFISLSSLKVGNDTLTSVNIINSRPVLEENIFSWRKQFIELGKLFPYSGLKNLYSQITCEPSNNPTIETISQEVRNLLSWHIPNSSESIEIDPDFKWIQTIAEVGNSSDGHTFEKLVRQSLVKLGFTNSQSNPKASLDPESTGGAGGLDICCREPYPLIGECKASKNQNVPTDVCSQLTYLGQTHFPEKYEDSIKVIFAAGTLTTPANNVAIGNKMNFMRPETLQRLVTVKAKYAGSIDLITLEPYLRKSPFGKESDSKVNHYIDEVLDNLKFRAKLIQIVKQLTQPDKRNIEVIQICNAYNITIFGLDNQSSWLDSQAVYEILIELSSPLIGYLGRLRGGGLSSDRFYYLRDLVIDETL